jgi:tripartite-type tricarboxylate transporter receptor subunit TctC
MKRFCAALAAALLAAPGAAMAQSDAFKGETMTYIVSTSPGGGYDTYGRLIAKYLQEHLGLDRVLVKNLPGAGHIVGANTLYAAEPDGLTIGTFNTGLIYAQLLKREGAEFDLTEMGWIGKAAADPRVIIVSADSGLESIDDIRSSETPVKFASSGVGSASFTDTHLIAQALDLPIEVVPGFNGNEGEMAMMRGEIAGQVGSLSSLMPFVENGFGKVVLTIGGEGIEGVPQGLDVATTDRGKSIISLVTAMSELARLTAGPPGVPEDRLQALRDAYEAAVTDPELLAEAEKLGIPIEPAVGEDVAQLIDAALDQSPETIRIIAAAVEAEAPTVTVNATLDEVSDGGREIVFKSGEETVKAGVSGSRTQVTIGGNEAKRDQLKAGMACEIEYDPANEDNEPARVACEG